MRRESNFMGLSGAGLNHEVLNGRPPIPDQFVFEKLVLFLRSGCSSEAFDELCSGSGISGRTCRRRFALWRDLGVFELVLEEITKALPEPAIAHVDATFVRSRGGGGDLSV